MRQTANDAASGPCVFCSPLSQPASHAAHACSPQPFKHDYLTGIITGQARLDGVEGDTFTADLHERDGNAEYWRRATGEKVRRRGCSLAAGWGSGCWGGGQGQA